jgi:hypothetical protein
MVTRSPEHVKVLLRKTVEGWEPVTLHDIELCSAYGVGSMVEAQFWQKRSVKHHRLYWVVLNELIENTDSKYGSAEDLHSAIKAAEGYTHRIKLLAPSENAERITKIIDELMYIQESHDLSGIPDLIKITEETRVECETLILPGSIAFDKMDQSEFKKFFEKAMNQLRRAGYMVDEAIERGKQKLAYIHRVVSRQHRPYHSERNVPQQAEISESTTG